MWIWDDVSSDDDPFYTNFDYDQSTLSGHLLMGPKPIDPKQGHVTLSARRYSKKRVEKYGSLNAASREKIVHGRLTTTFRSVVPESQAQLFPIAVDTREGIINNFFAIVPLNDIECVDREKSQITRWLVKDKIASSYTSLKLKDGCMSGLDLCRDSVTGLVVVSDRLKLALESSKEPGLHFSEPENLKTII